MIFPVVFDISPAKCPYASLPRQALFNVLAQWHISPSLPQSVVLENPSPFAAYHFGQIHWPTTAFEAIRRFPNAPFFQAGFAELSYGIDYDTDLWHWQTKDGEILTIDTAKDEQIYELFRDIYGELKKHDITQSWILVDDPPHTVSAGNTPVVLRRVTRFVNLAVSAGLTVGVRVTRFTQFRYWRRRLQPSFWLFPRTEEFHNTANWPERFWFCNLNGRKAQISLERWAKDILDYQPAGYWYKNALSPRRTYSLVNIANGQIDWSAEGIAFLGEWRYLQGFWDGQKSEWQNKARIALSRLKEIEALLHTFSELLEDYDD